MKVSVLVNRWFWLLLLSIGGCLSSIEATTSGRRAEKKDLVESLGGALPRTYSPLARPLVRHQSLKNERIDGKSEMNHDADAAYETYEKKVMNYLDGERQRHPVLLIPTFGGSVFKNLSSGTAACNSSSILFQEKNTSDDRVADTNSNYSYRSTGEKRARSLLDLLYKSLGYASPMETLSTTSGSLDLVYNETDGSFEAVSSQLGVIEDGRLCGIDLKSSSKESHYGYYFDYLIEKLVTHLNYTPDYDLLAFAYDYRFVADEKHLKAQFDQLKAMIEALYEADHKRVHLVAHGMGGVYALAFLNNAVDQAWKDTHLQGFITISSPFDGIRRTLEVLIGGEVLNDDYDDDDATSAYTYQVEKNNGAFIWMLPRPVEAHLNSAETTPPPHVPNFHYREIPLLNLKKFGTFLPSTTDMKDILFLLEETDYGSAYEYHAERLWKLASLRYPNISMTCIYGKGIATPLTYEYSMASLSNREKPSKISMTDGDGVATLDSLSLCTRWVPYALEQGRYMQVHELTGTDYEHTSILNTHELFDILTYEAFPLL